MDDKLKKLKEVAWKVGLVIVEDEVRESGQPYYKVFAWRDDVELARFYRCNEKRALSDLMYWLDGFVAAREQYL